MKRTDMKPFSIKEHLEHPDWKVVTREGEPVRILCTDLDDNDYPVAAATKNRHVDKYTAGGLFHAVNETKNDLFFAPKKHEGWLNIYRSESGFYVRGNPYKSKEEADEVAKANYKTFCTTVKIEWEE